MKLHNSNGESNQNFLELWTDGKFELQPLDNTRWCLSQHQRADADVVCPEKM